MVCRHLLMGFPVLILSTIYNCSDCWACDSFEHHRWIIIVTLYLLLLIFGLRRKLLSFVYNSFFSFFSFLIAAFGICRFESTKWYGLKLDVFAFLLDSDQQLWSHPNSELANVYGTQFFLHQLATWQTLNTMWQISIYSVVVRMYGVQCSVWMVHMWSACAWNRSTCNY